jgi:hypothetical protein
VEVRCHSCQALNRRPDKIGFRDECEKCGADLHACKSCDFYDPKVYNECRETSADVVREKERANYCDYYQPRKAEGAKNERDSLLAAAEALFKKKD